MQKVDTNKNWLSQFRPSAHGHRLKVLYEIYFFTVLCLCFNFPTNILSNSWDSLTNHSFLAPDPGPTSPWPRKKNLRHTFLPKWTQKVLAQTDERQQRYFTLYCTQSDRVTPLPLPIRVGEILLCPFLINSPTRFARRGLLFLQMTGLSLGHWGLSSI